MAKANVLRSLLRNVRTLIYEYMGFIGNAIDLNYIAIPIHAADPFQDDGYVYETSCFHDFRSTIYRREHYRTLDEYWEVDHDRFKMDEYEGSCHEDSCEAVAGGLSEGNCIDWANFYFDPDFLEFSITVWENNHFRVCSGSPGGYQSLLQLSSKPDLTACALSRITNLTIRIDGEPPESINLGEEWSRLDCLEPINLQSRYGKSALKNWTAFLQQLAGYVQPNHLNLYIIAEATDIKTAEAILEPLEQLPTLKGLGVWFNKKPIPELNALIQENIRRRTLDTSSVRAMPFRFLDLPAELRFRILEYSDLVYLSHRIWQPDISTMFLTESCDCREEDFNLDAKKTKHVFRCLNRQFDQENLDYRKSLVRPNILTPKHCAVCPRNARRGKCKKSMSGLCVCMYHCNHSASSSTMYSPREGVHPLFLVSRQVRHDAIPVFYQNNRFVISPPVYFFPRFIQIRGSPEVPIASRIRRFELSIFLESVPKDALRHIRHLEWFIPQPDDYLHAPRAAQLDYLDSLDVMVHAMSLSRLTLVLNFRCHWWELGYSPERDDWAQRSKKQGPSYDFVLQPLARLVGLKKCFVYLRRIKRMVGHTFQYKYVYDRDEMRYEKAIMGQGYDSSRKGKPWLGRVEQQLIEHYDHVTEYGDYVE